MTIDATFYSNRLAAAGAGLPPGRAGIGLCSVTGEYTLPATSDIDTNDLLKMVTIPAGATILDVIVTIPPGGIDTSTGLSWTVGDDGSENRFITTQTVGRSSAGGVVRANAGLGYKYTTENTIDIKFAGGATTNVTEGTIYLTAIYTMDP